MIAELSSAAGLRVLVASAVVPCFSLTTLTFPSCLSPAVEFYVNALWMVPEYTIAWVQDGEHFQYMCIWSLLILIQCSMYNYVEIIKYFSKGIGRKGWIEGKISSMERHRESSLHLGPHSQLHSTLVWKWNLGHYPFAETKNLVVHVQWCCPIPPTTQCVSNEDPAAFVCKVLTNRDLYTSSITLFSHMQITQVMGYCRYVPYTPLPWQWDGYRGGMFAI